MLITVTTEASISGTVWPAGTRLEAPEAAAKAAIAAGVATEQLIEATLAPAEAETEDEAPKRRGRPPKA